MSRTAESRMVESRPDFRRPLDLARRCAASRREAIGASTEDVGEMAMAMLNVWMVAQAAEQVLAAIAIEDESLTALQRAVLTDMAAFRGETPTTKEPEDGNAGA